MRLPHLIFAALLTAGAGTASAQTPPADGVTVAEARAWLIGVGGDVAQPETAGGRTSLRVADTLPWALSFYACTERCHDIQFEASFTGPIPEAVVADWNRQNRFAKAAWIAPATPGGEPTVRLQYDVLLTEAGPQQLDRATDVWLRQLAGFARALQGALRATATP